VLAVQRAVALLNGSAPPYHLSRRDVRLCRLLATDEIVRSARAWGVVEDAVDVRRSLRSGVGGLVIPTVGGPVIDRIGNDITLQTGPLTGGAVCFTLVQRFSLTDRDDAVRLMLPGH
jgi:hypothetical protein